MFDIVTEKYCFDCNTTKPIKGFSYSSKSFDGKTEYCKECRDKYKDVYIGLERGFLEKDIRNEIIKLLGSKCAKCSFTDIRALQIDHVRGGGNKELKKLGGQRLMYKKIYSQIISGNNNNEYQVLCANCNWIKRIENKEHKNQYTGKS